MHSFLNSAPSELSTLLIQTYQTKDFKNEPLKNGSISPLLETLPDKYVACTAQLFRFHDQCYLISAAHCLDNGFNNAFVDINNDKKKLWKLDVLRKNKELDIVQYDLPVWVKNSCEKLPDISHKVRNVYLDDYSSLFMSMRASGVLGGNVWTEYTRGSNWDVTGWGYSKPEWIDLGAINWLELKEIQIFPGMSGGLVEDNGGQIIGIISRYVPLQDLSIIVPFVNILRFITDGEFKFSQQDNNVYSGPWTSRSGSMRNASDNIFRDGGANEHGKGGGNEHGKGNFYLSDLRAQPEQLHKLVQEPDEGVKSKENEKLIILGIANHQIDGEDDFYNVSKRSNNEEKNIITRNADGYPAPQILKNVTQRFDAYYWPSENHEGVKHLVYDKKPENPMGVQLRYHAHTLTTLNFEENRIHLSFALHSLDERKNPLLRFLSPDILSHRAQKLDLYLEIKNSQDYKKLYLYGKEIKINEEGLKIETDLLWTCDNKHYLKIICNSTSDGLRHLSFSKTKTKDSILSLRYSYFNDTLFHYYYGKIKEVNPPEANGVRRIFTPNPVHEFRKNEEESSPFPAIKWPEDLLNTVNNSETKQEHSPKKRNFLQKALEKLRTIK